MVANLVLGSGHVRGEGLERKLPLCGEEETIKSLMLQSALKHNKFILVNKEKKIS